MCGLSILPVLLLWMWLVEWTASAGTAYLRLNGARVGRGVYVNTLFISDHNLLEFGDDVVIGAEVHISGHTVEGGVLKTAGVRPSGIVLRVPPRRS